MYAATSPSLCRKKWHVSVLPVSNECTHSLLISWCFRSLAIHLKYFPYYERHSTTHGTKVGILKNLWRASYSSNILWLTARVSLNFLLVTNDNVLLGISSLFGSRLLNKLLGEVKVNLAFFFVPSNNLFKLQKVPKGFVNKKRQPSSVLPLNKVHSEDRVGKKRLTDTNSAIRRARILFYFHSLLAVCEGHQRVPPDGEE